MKKLFGRSVVVVALVVVLSVLIDGVALAGGGWNKWQPIDHDVISGTFKFSDDTLLKFKEYGSYGNPVADFVAYLIPGMTLDDFLYFYNNVFVPICQPEGATLAYSFGAGHFAELTGRDLSELGFDYNDRIYVCQYAVGWHDAQP